MNNKVPVGHYKKKRTKCKLGKRKAIYYIIERTIHGVYNIVTMYIATQ